MKVVTLLVVAIALSCNNDDDDLAPIQTDVEIRAPSVDIDHLVANPVPYDGVTVRVAGSVGRILTDRAFIVDSQPSFGASHGIVVVTREPIRLVGPSLFRGNEVVVTGVVRGPGRPRIERALGRPLVPEVADTIAGPVLIANEVRRTGAQSRWKGVDIQSVPPISGVPR